MKYYLRYVVVLIIVLFLSSLSAQKKNITSDEFVSNVYDSITYSVTMGVKPIMPRAAGHLFVLHDSILSYLKMNMKGINVSITKYPNNNSEDSRFRCMINIGNFKCYNEAIPLKEKLISDGYTKSFIYGLQCQADIVPIESLRKITAKRCNEIDQLQNEVYGDTFPWDSITYRVRIVNCRDSIPNKVWSYLKSDRFFGIVLNIRKSSNETYQIDACNTIAIAATDRFTCYEDAVPLLKKIISDGYKDAYIAVYLCRNEISIEQAKKIKGGRCK